MPAHRAVLESENSSKADNARKNTAFPPVCKKCAKVCRAKISPLKQVIEFLFKAGKTVGFEPETAATISPA